MTSQRLKQIASVIVLSLTIALFIRFIVQNPQITRQIMSIPPHSIIALLGLYSVFQLTLVWIQRETLRLCDISLGRKESALLIMYSAIINFFGPLQSGPAFRAAYLKHKYNVSLKKYTFATLLYYGFYALFSAVFLMTYLAGLWALALIPIVFGLLPLIKTPIFGRFYDKFRIQLKDICMLALATLGQVCLLAVIFHIELQSIGQSIQAIPTLIYTAAANFALFISLTPGAIGFREAFLVFTGNFHTVSNQNIVAANLVDRGVYIIFLGILIVITTCMHARTYFNNRLSDQP